MVISEIQRKLNSLVNVVKDEEKVLILMHDNPDPDSIASAVGLQYLLGNLAKKPSLIGYSGIVGRAENRAMLKHLGIKMCSMSRISLQDYPCVALVDTQPLTGNNSLPPESRLTLSLIIILIGPPAARSLTGRSSRNTT